jgi:pimeloyl-ACP methyl ester carboxylesterase
MICSEATTCELAEVIPQSETVVFEEASHFLALEESQRFLSVLEEWLSRRNALDL